jgi:hypothetical protein
MYTEWAGAVQAVGVIAALLFTGYEFRARAKEQRFRNYLDAMAGFAETQVLMVQTPVLQALYEANAEDITAEYSELSPEQKTRVHYCDTLLGLSETVWVAHKKGWVDGDEWPYWERWLVHLHKSPEFRWTLSWVKTEYDHEFVLKIQDAASQPIIPPDATR